jgi:tagatose-1,6-bisphosphate aldolase non-catalytic subunit AgaZ/GatZ
MTTTEMRVCSRKECVLAGQPQPVTEFYRGRKDCRTCRRRFSNNAYYRRLSRARKNSPVAVVREGSRNLPIEPWRQWLHDREEQLGHEQLVRELGIADRVIYRWLHESVSADLDTVDRVLCYRGTPWLLRDLYPELYDLPELEEAA